MNGSNNETPGRGQLLETNLAGSDVKAWSTQFAAFRKLKPNLSRAIAHISLNLSPSERQISDGEFIEIATRFKEGLGYGENCPFILVRHHDREHQHAHLLLSRISADGGVVAETNDFRRAEKLAATLREEYGLKGPADKTKNEEEKAMEQQTSKRTLAIEARLEAATEETDAKLLATAEPDAPSIEAAGNPSAKQIRDWRREMLGDEYRHALDNLFIEQLRYVRKSTKAQTLYFKDGGRLHDTGERITAYATPNPRIAAQRLMELAAMRGWDSGITIRGSDEFLREAAAIALAKNLTIVAISAHQSAIFAEVRERMAADSMSSAAIANIEQIPIKPLPVSATEDSARAPMRGTSMMNGQGGLSERLAKMRQARDSTGGVGAPPIGSPTPGSSERM